jgi:hypothetical protein
MADAQEEESKEEAFFVDIQVERIKHEQRMEEKRKEQLRLRRAQVEQEARENLRALQEIQKKRLVNQGVLPKSSLTNPYPQVARRPGSKPAD